MDEHVVPTTDPPAGDKPLPRAFEQVPAQSPLAMPEQDFDTTPPLIARRRFNIDLWARRLLVIALTLIQDILWVALRSNVSGTCITHG